MKTISLKLVVCLALLVVGCGGAAATPDTTTPETTPPPAAVASAGGDESCCCNAPVDQPNEVMTRAACDENGGRCDDGSTDPAECVARSETNE
jgi:hypothetical protein